MNFIKQFQQNTPNNKDNKDTIEPQPPSVESSSMSVPSAECQESKGWFDCSLKRFHSMVKQNHTIMLLSVPSFTAKASSFHFS